MTPPTSMVTSVIPESPRAGLPSDLSDQRPPAPGMFLLVLGILVSGLGAVLEGALIIWIFGRPAGPFNSSYNSFQWGQASTAVLFGAGIFLVGLGWTLDERRRQLLRDSTVASPGRSAGTAGFALVILGASVAAFGEFLYAAVLILGLEGISSLANALGPGWIPGGPDVLLGVGLLLAATGVFVLWRAGDWAARRA